MNGTENGHARPSSTHLLVPQSPQHHTGFAEFRPSSAALKRSASFEDIRTVDAEETGLLPRIKRSKEKTVVDMGLHGLKAHQEHENELAEVVIVCEPEQASLMMGGLHPRGSLYERPVNFEVAKAQHAEFRNQVRPAQGHGMHSMRM